MATDFTPSYKVDVSPRGFTGADTLSLREESPYAVLIDHQKNDLDEMIGRIAEKTNLVNRSNQLTPSGKTEQRKKIGRDALEELNKLGRRREKIDHDVKRYTENTPRGPLPAPINPHDLSSDASVFHQNIAAANVNRIMGNLISKQPIEAKSDIEVAAKQGDHMIMYATQAMPQAFREKIGIYNGDLEALQEEYWRNKKPEAFERLDHAKEAQMTFNMNMKHAERSIFDIAGVAQDRKIDPHMRTGVNQSV